MSKNTGSIFCGEYSLHFCTFLTGEMDKKGKVKKVQD